MSRKALQIVLRYNRVSDRLEKDAIARLNRSIDASYQALEREFLRQYSAISQQPSLLARQQTLILLNDLSTLMSAIADNPNYQATFEQLLNEAIALGGEQGVELLRTLEPSSEVRTLTTIPMEAIALQARDGVRRLQRHSESFRNRASGVIEQSLIRQLGASGAAKLLRRELGLLKTQAETIARTETMSALNDAAQMRYQEARAESQWVATPSDALCPYCAARNGFVYKAGTVKVPAHPRCRCSLLPYKASWGDDGFMWEYRDRILQELRQSGKEPNYGLTPFERAARLEKPPEPIYRPTRRQAA